MSNNIPGGLRDCWTLSLSLRGYQWVSNDGVLTVNVSNLHPFSFIEVNSCLKLSSLRSYWPAM